MSRKEPELDADRRLIIREDGTTLKRTPTEADLDAGVTEPELDADRRLIIQEDGTTLKRTPTEADLDVGVTRQEKTLDGIIDSDLWKQMETRSLNILAETAYDCLNEEQSQRPNIDEIVTRLEKALEL
nr:protein kinase-like domain, phloem protein 2-like protein [Tanacetum cinerariifolium]